MDFFTSRAEDFVVGPLQCCSTETVLESSLLFVVRERMWHDAVVGGSCVKAH